MEVKLIIKENNLVIYEEQVDKTLKRIREKKIDDIVFVIKSSSKKNSKIKKNEITKNLILKNLEFSPERCKLEKEKIE